MQTVFGVYHMGLSLLPSCAHILPPSPPFFYQKTLKLPCVNNEDNFLCDLGDLGTVGRGTHLWLWIWRPARGAGQERPAGICMRVGFSSAWLCSRLVLSGLMVEYFSCTRPSSVASWLVWRSSTLYSTAPVADQGLESDQSLSTCPMKHIQLGPLPVARTVVAHTVHAVI